MASTARMTPISKATAKGSPSPVLTAPFYKTVKHQKCSNEAACLCAAAIISGRLLKNLSESFDVARDERREFYIVDDLPFMLRFSKHS